jgi:hypothetical protein
MVPCFELLVPVDQAWHPTDRDSRHGRDGRTGVPSCHLDRGRGDCDRLGAPGLEPGAPLQTVFDEAWHTFDAVAYLGGAGLRRRRRWWGSNGDSTPQHPPLGRWLIAAGVHPCSGHIGWRLPSMVFGVAGVLLVYLPALWRSPGWVGLAAC